MFDHERISSDIYVSVGNKNSRSEREERRSWAESKLSGEIRRSNTSESRYLTLGHRLINNLFVIKTHLVDLSVTIKGNKNKQTDVDHTAQSLEVSSASNIEWMSKMTKLISRRIFADLSKLRTANPSHFIRRFSARPFTTKRFTYFDLFN